MIDPRMCAHVVQLADYGGPYPGTFVSMLRALAVEAQRRGHHITIRFSEVARQRDWLPELETAADVNFLAARHGPSAARNVRRQLGPRSEATVLHTHFTRFDVAAVLAAAGRPRTAVFWHVHSPLRTEPLVRVRNTLRFSLLGRRVDAALGVSPEIRDALVARGFPGSRAHYLSNALDLRLFPPITARERISARERLGLPLEAIVVLHFGWDWLRKGGDLVLEVADLLGNAIPELIVATVLAEGGRGAPLEAIDQRSSVRRFEPSADVNMFYAAADLFLSPSRAEGMPLAVLEAVARGLPVVATDISGQRVILEKFAGSHVVAPDPERLASAIREVLATGADGRGRQAAEARRLLEESFALEPWAGQVLGFYERALAERGC